MADFDKRWWKVVKIGRTSVKVGKNWEKVIKIGGMWEKLVKVEHKLVRADKSW